MPELVLVQVEVNLDGRGRHCGLRGTVAKGISKVCGQSLGQDGSPKR